MISNCSMLSRVHTDQILGKQHTWREFMIGRCDVSPSVTVVPHFIYQRCLLPLVSPCLLGSNRRMFALTDFLVQNGYFDCFSWISVLLNICVHLGILLSSLTFGKQCTISPQRRTSTFLKVNVLLVFLTLTMLAHIPDWYCWDTMLNGVLSMQSISHFYSLSYLKKTIMKV